MNYLDLLPDDAIQIINNKSKWCQKQWKKKWEKEIEKKRNEQQKYKYCEKLLKNV